MFPRAGGRSFYALPLLFLRSTAGIDLRRFQLPQHHEISGTADTVGMDIRLHSVLVQSCVSGPHESARLAGGKCAQRNLLHRVGGLLDGSDDKEGSCYGHSL